MGKTGRRIGDYLDWLLAVQERVTKFEETLTVL